MVAKSIVLVSLAALCGCDKSSSSSSSAKTTGAEPAATTPAKPPASAAPDFAAWDMAGKQKAWQGSWVLKENGTFQAWSITGDKIQTWDGKEDKVFTLRLSAPCRADFEHAVGGGTMSEPREFAVTDGKLRFRAGGAGFRKGTEAIYCDPSGETYMLSADGQCVSWKSGFHNSWEKKPAECGLKKDAKGADIFFHKGSNEGEFAIQGDAILSDTSADTEPAADYATAKTTRDAKK